MIVSASRWIACDLRQLSTGSRGWSVFAYAFVLTLVLC